MTSREEDEQAVYEQEQVLWAKIRGYPWWPAFVDKVHPISRGEEAHYTVFFFGDNTQYFSSKLGASKLRKFYDCYTECYQKARSHRKLMLSIQQAEKKLEQNDQNIEIFEELRNTLKPKKGKSQAQAKNESVRSEHNESEKGESMPQLNKSKTYGHNRQKHEGNEELQKSQSKMKDQIQSTLKKDTSAKKSQKGDKAVDKLQKILPFKRLKRGLRSNKEDIFEEQQSKQHEPIDVFPKQQQPDEMIAEPEQQQASSSHISIIVDDQRSQADNPNARKTRYLTHTRRLADLRRKDAPRKRGRPKKPMTDRTVQRVDEENSLLKYRSILQKTKMKPIRKQVARAHQMEVAVNALSEADNEIIETIKDTADNRGQLIDYLSSIEITVSNVKQILDLDVSNILQDGIVTEKISDLLQLMKSALLFKYFPEDIKHKKKYDKLMKKKLVIRRERVSRDSRDSERRQEAEMKEESSESKSQERQIRKKTLAKLQKFLKSHGQIQNRGKEMAERIESFFQRADGSIGERYKSMAYKVLKSLKEKTETFSEVMKNLEHHRYA